MDDPTATPPVPPSAPRLTPDDPVDVEGKLRDPTRYEKSLRGRLAAAEAATEAARTEAAAQVAAARAERDTAVTAERQAASLRLAQADLRAKAVAAGIVDADALALADMSKLTVGADGAVTGADEIIAGLREAKPYLFAAPTGAQTGTTSTTDRAPTPAPTSTKRAMEMTDDEYAALRASYTRRR
jgi:hypothetical protein